MTSTGEQSQQSKPVHSFTQDCYGTERDWRGHTNTHTNDPPMQSQICKKGRFASFLAHTPHVSVHVLSNPSCLRSATQVPKRWQAWQTTHRPRHAPRRPLPLHYAKGAVGQICHAGSTTSVLSYCVQRSSRAPGVLCYCVQRSSRARLVYVVLTAVPRA